MRAHLCTSETSVKPIRAHARAEPLRIRARHIMMGQTKNIKRDRMPGRPWLHNHRIDVETKSDVFVSAPFSLVGGSTYIHCNCEVRCWR